MANIDSAQDGPWDVGATWVGGTPPGDGDTADIYHDVYIRTAQAAVTVGPNSGAACSTGSIANCSIIVRTGGLFRFEETITNTYTLTLKGPILVFAGGEFRIGTEGDPVPASKIITLDFGQGSYEYESTIVGKLTLRGAVAYHMGSASMQRTTLAADVTANPGTPVAFQTKEAVDWQVGDSVWVGTGGDPNHAPTGAEEITIATKVDSTHYTADFANNHFGDSTHGDMLVHGDRNVILKGASVTQGFSIGINESYSQSVTGQCDIAWVRFEYGGKGLSWYQAVIGITTWATNKLAVDMDYFRVQNCVFYTPGDSTSYGLFLYQLSLDEPDENFTQFKELHFWGWTSSVAVRLEAVQNQLRLGHVSTLNCRQGINPLSCDADIRVKGFWYGPNSTGGVFYGVVGQMISIEDFKMHYGHYGMNMTDSASNNDINAGYILRWKNGEIFNMLGTGYAIYMQFDSDSALGEMIFENVHFWTSYRGLWVTVDGPREKLIFRDCKFDNQNTADDGAQSGGVMLYEGNQYGDVLFDNCEFGTNDPNHKWNIFFRPVHLKENGIRVVANECIFKKPANFSQNNPTYHFIEEEWQWSIWGGQLNHYWTYLSYINQYGSYEMINCQILNDSDVDQWDTLFPNCDRVALAVAGTQVRKTPDGDGNGYIDGTYQRTFYPLMGLNRMHMRCRPLQIPVESGETVTVRLSFKKDVSQAAGLRPGLHLEGCGVEDADYMDDVNNTWDELEVNGTAQYTGVMEVWPSFWGVRNPTLSPPKQPTTLATYAYPHEYKYRGGGSANLKLFVDGLEVEVTGDPTTEGDDGVWPVTGLLITAVDQVAISSALSLSSTSVRINFDRAVRDNNALRYAGNYVLTGVGVPDLTVYSVTPEAVTNPTYVILETSEQAQDASYQIEIQQVEEA